MFYVLFAHLVILFIIYLIFFNKEYFEDFFQNIGIHLPNNKYKYYQTNVKKRDTYDFKI